MNKTGELGAANRGSRSIRPLAGRISVLWLFFGLLPAGAFAWGYSGSGTISRIIVDTQDGLIEVYGQTAWQNPDSCTTSALVVIPMTGNYKDAEAAVYIAYVTGRQIQFGLNGCTYGLGGGYGPLVTYADMTGS